MGWLQLPHSPARAWLVSGGLYRAQGVWFRHRTLWHRALGFFSHPEKSRGLHLLCCLINNSHMGDQHILLLQLCVSRTGITWYSQ